MANSLLTTSKITREAVILFLNSNLFIQSIDRQYDSEFGKKGEKIGSQLRIRLPIDPVVTKGPALSAQDMVETQTVLTMATQAHVDLAFTTADLYLGMDAFADRVLEPAMNNLAGQVAVDMMNVAEIGYVPASSNSYASPLVANTGGVCNAVGNFSGSTLINPVIGTVLSAKAALEDNSAPTGKRKIVWDPWSESRIVSSLSGLFNPQARISRQYESGEIKNALGFDHFMDQTVIKHTTGSFTSGTVNGAGQTGYTITTNAITGTLNVGDIITFAGVYAVNRVTKQTTGNLRQFVVTSAAANGATQISIYPAMTPPATVNGASVAVQYQTVTASPANSAAITLYLGASITARKNIAYAPEGLTMATGDLPLPPNTDSARAQYDGVSLRMVNQYIVGTDQEVHRVDALYGGLMVRPEWGVAIYDAI